MLNRVTQVIDDIRHSVFALRGLPPKVQMAVRLVYYDAIKMAFIASTCFAALAVLASMFANGKRLERASPKSKNKSGKVSTEV